MVTISLSSVIIFFRVAIVAAFLSLSAVRDFPVDDSHEVVLGDGQSIYDCVAHGIRDLGSPTTFSSSAVMLALLVSKSSGFIEGKHSCQTLRDRFLEATTTTSHQKLRQPDLQP